MGDGRPSPFKLERFFEKHEFTAPHLLCCSDSEPMKMAELLALADDDARRRWEGLQLSYTETAGLPALREAVADLYGGTVTPRHLLVCVPEEGIYLTMQALLNPGDRVVCVFPAYQSLYELALSLKCTLDLWEPSWDEAAGKLRFDVGALEALVPGDAAKGRPPARLVVVNFPHNPTGATVGRAEQARVVAACEAAGAHLFSDEMYWQSEPDEAARLPPAASLYDRAITLCGMSKSWCLPGLRIGWVATRDADLLARVSMLKDYTTICSPAPSEVLALIAVRATGRVTGRARKIIAANEAEAGAFFARWPRVFQWSPPDAGPIAFPRLRVESLPPLVSGAAPFSGIDDFSQRLVGEAGVLLLPASVYDDGPSTARGHFRLGLGRAAVPEGLRHLEAFLVKHFGAPSGQ